VKKGASTVQTHQQKKGGFKKTLKERIQKKPAQRGGKRGPSLEKQSGWLPKTGRDQRKEVGHRSGLNTAKRDGQKKNVEKKKKCGRASSRNTAVAQGGLFKA